MSLPRWSVITGDCLDVLRGMPGSSVDAVVTDAPYGLSDHKPADVVACLTAWLAGEAYRPTKRGFMGTAWDAWVPGPEVWREVYRVLKPGGHALVFAGSRTVDLMGIALRLAGFDVRDSLQWLYGTGFPKSLDVSKAIDAAAGVEREVVGFDASAVRPNRVNRGLVNAAGGGSFGPDNGATITAPATPEAERWDGWGTALKPAHEPILLLRKPLMSVGTNVLKMVESALRERGVEGPIEWTSAPVSAATRRSRRTSSSSTAAHPAAGASVVNVDGGATPSDERRTASSSAPITPVGVAPTVTTSARTPEARPPSCGPSSSTPTAEPAPAATSDRSSSSPSTTSTAAAQHIGSPSTARSTTSSGDRDSPTVIESFAGIATGLTTSRAVAHIDRLTDGTFVWPDGLPRSVPGDPLTVAANVLEHGTGALNIDACRIGTTDHLPEFARRAGERPRDEYRTGTGARTGGATGAGRWPANVVLDEAAAAQLDKQAGALSVTGRRTTASRDAVVAGTRIGTSNHRSTEYPGDTGGASRFFYTAKAIVAEREAGLAGATSRQDPTRDPDAPGANNPRNRGGRERLNAHPTVKPVDLMRWLCRLVTPPGGLVLDPFAGSGTTGIAAVLEGFDFIGVELDPEHADVARRRIAHHGGLLAREESPLPVAV